VALAAMGAAGLAAPPEALARVEWPGRFQRLGWDGRLVLDGAHNPHGSRALADTWTDVFGNEKAVILFGAVASKDHAEMIAALVPIAARFIFTTVDSPRAVPAAELAASAPAGSAVTISLTEALALAPRGPGHPPVLVCGSLYLVGQALAELGGYEGGFERSAQ
jgi:dihydrofolate synthase/folylpolyglutamate synthase